MPYPLEEALKIDGWLTQQEAETLYDLAKEATGPIAEIGSWQGRSTACLALGTKAGKGQRVYAVDPFVGPQEGTRRTSLNTDGQRQCSPELLRSNLDKVGINGEVEIIPLPSHEHVAQTHVPDDLALLFIDGDHSYQAVCSDLALYLPKVREGGYIVLHDVVPGDPGVVAAFDHIISTRPLAYRVMGRVDSAVVVQKVKTERLRIALGCPGRFFGWGTVQGILEASLGAHEVRVLNSGNGWDDFNAIWAQALNLAEAETVTHFAMLHSDVVPDAGWLDVLVGELTSLQADLVSVAIPIKDKRGLTSCGLGDPDNRWGAFRRFTMRELMSMPATFSLADTPHPDKVLLHNTGCWVVDLSCDFLYDTLPDGALKCFFDFPTRIARLPDGQWAHSRESEDWFFSRQLHVSRAKSFITRKVRLRHRGEADYVNFAAWGSYKDGDEDTAENWRKS